jgi:ABC-2 type transport system permease protein
VVELTGEKPISARLQFLAVAWMRWRIFINNFHRRSAATKPAALIVVILLRILVWSFVASGILGAAVAAGFFAWTSVAHHHPDGLALLLAGIFLMWQYMAVTGVSVAAQISSFDPSSLIRFPIPFLRYVLLRLLLGLLTATTISGCAVLLAAAIGIGIADQALLLPALAVLATYAITNIFFARMVGAWVERWLSNRRAREISGVLFALFIIGVEFLNFHQNAGISGRHSSVLFNLLTRSGPFLRYFPAGLASSSIRLALAHPFAALLRFGGVLAYSALFLAILAVRLHKQFLGEDLSEGSSRSAALGTARREITSARPQTERPASGARLVSPALAACLRKEWLYIRGDSRQFIALLTPLVFVVILSSGRGVLARHPAFLLPGAIAYVLSGPVGRMFNVFGQDAAGVQLYLLAPVRLREVVIAKNIASMFLPLASIVLTWAVVLWITPTPIPAATHISTALWALFVVAVNLTLGTVRSIQAPRRFVPGKTPRSRASSGQTSGLLVIAVIFGSLFLLFPIIILGRYLHDPWLAVPIFLILDAGALFGYAVMLRQSDQLMLNHREVFTEELCKIS